MDIFENQTKRMSQFSQRMSQTGPIRRPHNYPDFFHPYLNPPDGAPADSRFIYAGYPYPDPRYFPQMIAPYHRSSIFPPPNTPGGALLRFPEEADNYERHLRFNQGKSAPPIFVSTFTVICCHLYLSST